MVLIALKPLFPKVVSLFWNRERRLNSMQSFPEGNWRMPRPGETTPAFHTSTSLVNVPRVKRLSVSGGAIWFWRLPIPCSIVCLPSPNCVVLKASTARKADWCMVPVVKPIMRLSGLTTRQSISILSSLSWVMRLVMSPHWTLSATLPAIWIRSINLFRVPSSPKVSASGMEPKIGETVRWLLTVLHAMRWLVEIRRKRVNCGLWSNGVWSIATVN